MAYYKLKLSGFGVVFSLLLALFSVSFAEELRELEEFVAEETALEDSDSLLPTELSVDSVFGNDISVIDVPKSVLILTPEEMDQFGIESLSDLANVGAGTAQYNDFGLPGAPYLRGWKAGIYFNGMLRGYQVNELPTSFGSLERIDLVKGIAPAQLMSTCIGGYANFVPKSPYFDEFRGSVEMKVTQYGQWNTQLDLGGPTMLFDEIPSAYRISITGQEGQPYYDDVRNDFISIYASIKAEIADGVKIYTGGEYFSYKSNEQPGWNRLTQNLIDHDEYVIGEPLSMVSSNTGGIIDRDLLDFHNFLIYYGGSGYGLDLGGDPMSADNLHGFSNRAEVFNALTVSPDAIRSALASGTISQAHVDAMINMGDEAVRADVYNGFSPDITQTTSGYVYTPEYFGLGGDVLTSGIDGDNILADEDDKADSENFIYFFDIVDASRDGLTLNNKVYVEYLSTDKESSYGYAARTKQKIFDDKAYLEMELPFISFPNHFTLGAEYRYTWARGLQDYWVEPFARRDLTNQDISGNSVMAVGKAISGMGGTYWTNGNADDPGYLGNNRKSTLHQAGLFTSLEIEFSEKLTTYFGLRGEHASWDLGISPETKVNYSIADAIGKDAASGDTDYYNFGFNPVFSINDDWKVYGGYQYGTTYVPNDFGFVMGEDSFADGEYLELGIKGSSLDGKLFVTAAIYEWEQTGFTAFSDDPQEYEGKGYELEANWAINDSLMLIASFTHQVVKNNNGFIPFGSRDWSTFYLADGSSEQGLALGSGLFYAGVADPTEANPDLEVPGAPQDTYKLFLLYSINDEWSVSGGAVWNDDYFANYEASLSIPSSMVVNANIMYQVESWEVKLAIENLNDEEYYFSSDPIVGGNTLVTKAPGINSSVVVKYKF